MNIADLEAALKPWGLKLRGLVALSNEEVSSYGFEVRENTCSVALVGNIGSSFWPVFSQSPEFIDDKADPLDRWSRRAASEVAGQFNAIAIYPFQGPPYLPFQQWAQRAEALHQSPLGLMIHPRYGLWHAYRFALITDLPVDASTTQQDSPCLSCEDQPCLNNCPVNAMTTEGYDVPICVDYLRKNPTTDCFYKGCMARFSCPVGSEFKYVDEQSQFHLDAFFTARPA